MVDRLDFQKILPSLSTAKKVTRTDRQKEQNQYSAFKKLLRQKKDGDKDKEKNQNHNKKNEKISIYRQDLKDDYSRINDSNELTKIEKKYQGSLIDVRA